MLKRGTKYNVITRLGSRCRNMVGMKAQFCDWKARGFWGLSFFFLPRFWLSGTVIRQPVHLRSSFRVLRLRFILKRSFFFLLSPGIPGTTMVVAGRAARRARRWVSCNTTRWRSPRGSLDDGRCKTNIQPKKIYKRYRNIEENIETERLPSRICGCTVMRK